ncbi:MAG: KpsF/GutQ family sugar-phosphate isomerase [Cellvibrionaceae bacterium]|nr:KpsF/GutQ family sugar-phosphate isomerase [Cellvibrionaceae bacterium]
MNVMTQSFDFIASAKRTLSLERAAIDELAARFDKEFTKACQCILACKGRVVVTGMGKSGHIGNKVAATLASTGTPAFFVHPGEASHGDLGMITSEDIIIAISNSGGTAEVLTMLPTLKRIGAGIIALTGKAQSPLAQSANVVLDISVTSEACPLDLAPTSSTTVTLVMGDALAVALLEARGFTAEDFAFAHPGGALGRKLLLKVEDIMHIGDRVPSVDREQSLMSSLAEMSNKGFGITAVVDSDNKLCGVFTDGDLRRCIDDNVHVKHAKICDIMSRNPQVTHPQMLAAEAFNLMEKYKITALLVVDPHMKLMGIVHMHDMLKAGLV